MMDPEIIRELQSRAKPAAIAVRSETGGISKLGGLPHLPAEIQWPRNAAGPLAFLAQIDFAELARAAPLPGFPAEGVVFFFYDAEAQPWGFDPKHGDGFALLYANAAAINPASAPADLPPRGVFNERRLGFRAFSSTPSWERMGGYENWDDADYDAVHNWQAEPFGGAPMHQLGGYPRPVQGDDMDLESQLASHGIYCGDASGYAGPRMKELAPGAADWRLLLQLDTDDDIGWMWGDCGRLYFWIREQDLRAPDFRRAWTILQCS